MAKDVLDKKSTSTSISGIGISGISIPSPGIRIADTSTSSAVIFSMSIPGVGKSGAGIPSADISCAGTTPVIAKNNNWSHKNKRLFNHPVVRLETSPN